MRQRILFVGNDGKFFLRTRLALALAAKKAGYEVAVALPDRWAFKVLQQAGIDMYFFPLRRSGMSIVAELQTCRALYDLYVSLDVDLIHHISLKASVYGSMAARFAGTPAVNTFTGLGFVFTETGFKNRLLKGFIHGLSFLGLKKHAFSVFQNASDREELIDKGMVLAENSSVIKGSGIDVDDYSVRENLEGDFKIVLVARMLWSKGIKEFVTAASKLAGKARFILVGDSDGDNPAAICRDQLESWHHTCNIEWWGWQDDVKSILASSDVVCLPSYREGIPNSLLEAMAMGKPIVTTDAPGCRDVVRDNENGFMVPVKDSDALAEAFEKLIGNKDLCQKMGATGRVFVNEEFSMDKVNQEYLDIYKRCTHRQGSRPGSTKVIKES